MPELRAVLVLEHLVRAGPVPVHFASARPLLGDFARPGSLIVHVARAGPAGAFARAGSAVWHLVRAERIGPLLVRAVRVGPLPVHLRRPPKPGIGLTMLRLAADGFQPAPDRQL